MSEQEKYIGFAPDGEGGRHWLCKNPNPRYKSYDGFEFYATWNWLLRVPDDDGHFFDSVEDVKAAWDRFVHTSNALSLFHECAYVEPMSKKEARKMQLVLDL